MFKRVRGEQSPRSCIRNALMLPAWLATKSLKIVIFNHLMLVDAKYDDSVTIPKPGCGLLKKNFFLRAYARISCTPLFQIHPCYA